MKLVPLNSIFAFESIQLWLKKLKRQQPPFWQTRWLNKNKKSPPSATWWLSSITCRFADVFSGSISKTHGTKTCDSHLLAIILQRLTPFLWNLSIQYGNNFSDDFEGTKGNTLSQIKIIKKNRIGHFSNMFLGFDLQTIQPGVSRNSGETLATTGNSFRPLRVTRDVFLLNSNPKFYIRTKEIIRSPMNYGFIYNYV